MTSETQRLDLLGRFMAAWNARDVDALMACMAETCEFRSSAGPEACGRSFKGREAVRASYAAMFENFPESRWTEDRHFVTGDRGVSEWRFVGTDKSGNAVDVDGCDLFTFEGGLIALKDSFRKMRAG